MTRSTPAIDKCVRSLDIDGEAAWQRRVMLHATLWELNGDVTTILRCVFAQTGCCLRVVRMFTGVLASAERVHSDDFVIADCACVLSDALDRGMQVVMKADVPVYIIHPDSGVASTLQGVAQSEVRWLPPEHIGLPFLKELRLLQVRKTRLTEQSSYGLSPLTRREEELYRLLVKENLNRQQIAELWYRPN